ncbi:MAG: hypothetical protein DRJ03_14735 [Chloroflexi bacterium]|nr:MAG: hypothetical protein DRI81_07365 [Chloroflexota bacterium]RLC84260.1 MAG: hypothetical protein DRJ03_14735 [Chloroflexota bacterium]
MAMFSKNTVADMPQNRFYVGEVQYKGVWHEGVHEPIIPQDLFDRCQEIRRKRRRRTGMAARSAPPRCAATPTNPLPRPNRLPAGRPRRPAVSPLPPASPCPASLPAASSPPA